MSLKASQNKSSPPSQRSCFSIDSTENSDSLEFYRSSLATHQNTSCSKKDTIIDRSSEFLIQNDVKFDGKEDNKKDLPSSTVFNTVNELSVSVVPRLSSSSSIDGYAYGYNCRVRSSSPTPTASSEASWNSQTGLLSNPPGSIPVSLSNNNTNCCNNEQRKKKGCSYSAAASAIKWFLGPRKYCCCNGKKSVEVEETISVKQMGKNMILGVKKQSRPMSFVGMMEDQFIGKSHILPVTKDIETRNQNTIISNSGRFVSESEQHLMFPYTSSNEEQRDESLGPRKQSSTDPMLNCLPLSVPVSAPVLPLSINPNSLKDPTRDSLDSFQQQDEMATVLELIHAAANQKSSIEITDMLNQGGSSDDDDDDDVGSDTSSDLFEIENFPIPINYRKKKESLDEALFNSPNMINEPITSTTTGNINYTTTLNSQEMNPPNDDPTSESLNLCSDPNHQIPHFRL